jgi:hypothetical protein
MTGLRMDGPWSSVRPHAIRLLRHGHRALRQRLRRLVRAKTAAERGAALAAFEGEMVASSRVCHEVLYPAYRGVARKEKHRRAYFEVAELHREVELLLHDCSRCDPAGARFAGCVQALRLAVGNLLREESRRLVPYARHLLGRANLQAVGRAMQDHRRAVLRNPALPARRAATIAA